MRTAANWDHLTAAQPFLHVLCFPRSYLSELIRIITVEVARLLRRVGLQLVQILFREPGFIAIQNFLA